MRCIIVLKLTTILSILLYTQYGVHDNQIYNTLKIHRNNKRYAFVYQLSFTRNMKIGKTTTAYFVRHSRFLNLIVHRVKTNS